MLPDRSTASSMSRPACGGCTTSPSCCGRAAAMHSKHQPSHASQWPLPARAATAGRGDGVEARAVRHFQRGRGVARRGQQRAHQPWQRQGQQQPGPGESADRRKTAKPTIRSSLHRHPCQETIARDALQGIDFRLRRVGPIAAFAERASHARDEHRRLRIRHRGSAASRRPAAGRRRDRAGSRPDAAARTSAATFAAGVGALAMASSNRRTIASRRRLLRRSSHAASAQATSSEDRHAPPARCRRPPRRRSGHVDVAQDEFVLHLRRPGCDRAAAARIRWAHRSTAPAHGRRARAVAPARHRRAA